MLSIFTFCSWLVSRLHIWHISKSLAKPWNYLWLCYSAIAITQGNVYHPNPPFWHWCCQYGHVWKSELSKKYIVTRNIKTKSIKQSLALHVWSSNKVLSYSFKAGYISALAWSVDWSNMYGKYHIVYTLMHTNCQTVVLRSVAIVF